LLENSWKKKDAKTREKKATRDLSKGKSKGMNSSKGELATSTNTIKYSTQEPQSNTDNSREDEPKKLTLKDDTLTGKLKKAQGSCCGN